MSNEIFIFSKTQDAEQTPFDNTDNGFTSENVQDAIEEAAGRGPTIETVVGRLIVMNDSRYGVFGDRRMRVVSPMNNEATIVEGVIEVRTEGRTIVNSSSTLRVTGS